MSLGRLRPLTAADKPRVLVTSDGEIDDECSLVRFLLYANEWDVEGIITSSSQYHWQGHKWAGDDWAQPYLKAYAEVYPNLVKHDPDYPTPEFLQSRTCPRKREGGGGHGRGDARLGTDRRSPAGRLRSAARLDPGLGWAQHHRARPEDHRRRPSGRMAEVAKKIRFYFIWEQDETFQNYIRPHWGRLRIHDHHLRPVHRHLLPLEEIPAGRQAGVPGGSWMKPQHPRDHGPLCSLYKAHGKKDKGFDDGDFRSEGDSPAFLHTIPTGLRSMESPGWGGWGGRFVRVRDNTWLDPVSEPGYQYPEGRWFTGSAWGRTRLKKEIPNDAELTAYLKPQWRWIDALQNDFAARADWCVKRYSDANHPPVVKLAHARDLERETRRQIPLSAEGTADPDGDGLTYRWWQYHEAGT